MTCEFSSLGIIALIHYSAIFQIAEVVRTSAFIDLKCHSYQFAWCGLVGVLFPVYSQCLWKNVQKYRLVTDFSDNPDVSRVVRRASTLPLIPVYDVSDVWWQVLEGALSSYWKA